MIARFGRWRWVLVLLGGGCAALAVWWHWSAPPEDRPAPTRVEATSVRVPDDDDDFVGSEACGACHVRIWESYRRHPMGRSLATPQEAEVVEDYADRTVFSPPGAREYEVVRAEDGGVRHIERMRNSAGELLYDQGLDVSYVLGSGKRGRAYLFERGGMLFKSSIAWYSRRGEWDLAPGYDPANHQRFERRITDGCMNCHAGRMAVAHRGEPDRYLTPAVHEERIGCERCHGPGRRHVERHESGLAEEGDEWIVHPARLESDARDSLCAQCHLHGEAAVVRSGRSVFDFRPGEVLEETRLVFVAGSGALQAAPRAVSQVEQMTSSVCYQKSGGRMGCTSCHDPHAVPDPQALGEYYREKCLSCHAQRGCSMPQSERLAQDSADSCIGCHMPALHAKDILHVSVADHRILRRSESEPELVAEQSAAAKTLFGGAEQRLPAWEVDRAQAFVWLGESRDARPAREDARRAGALLKRVHERTPDDLDVLEALGVASAVQGNLAEAQRYWDRALQIDPRREAVLRDLALVHSERIEVEPARQYLERFLEVNPWHGSFYGRYAGTLGLAGEWEAGIQAAERALELNPTLAPLHDWLSEAYRQVGNPLKSGMHQQLFERFQKKALREESEP
ncbi:MAG: tetratricopeptide repeat protein [Planctomycetales bacterium]